MCTQKYYTKSLNSRKLSSFVVYVKIFVHYLRRKMRKGQTNVARYTRPDNLELVFHHSLRYQPVRASHLFYFRKFSSVFHRHHCARNPVTTTTTATGATTYQNSNIPTHSKIITYRPPCLLKRTLCLKFCWWKSVSQYHKEDSSRI